MGILKALTMVYIAAAGAFVASGYAEALLNHSLTEKIVENHRQAVGESALESDFDADAAQSGTILQWRVGKSGRFALSLLRSGARLALGDLSASDLADYVVDANHEAESLRYVGQVLLRDEFLHQIHTESADGSSRDYFLDRETYLVRAVALQRPQSDLVEVSFFDGYQQVKGMMVPSERLHATDDDQKELDALLSASGLLGGVEVMQSKAWGAHLLPGQITW